ncbi:MAG TPA: NAD(P)(+) transhydrogenase (Re/Si-specific) subunit beta, partial [Polyangiaceae bacterium]|nr:NAD(P)(+) transhydrogenase (Re/Si-specific) subunit beta [Polyangiaceae bacterium]
MPESLTTIAYLVAGVLFILSLAGLSTQKTARRGNAFGIAGMLLALGVTAVGHVHSYGALAVAVAVGSVIGALLALRVEMTSMPELVAVLHSFVGLAAVLVGV